MSAVDPAGRFRIARPEDDHLSVFQTVFHGAVGLAAAIVSAISPVVRRTPIPAFPTVRVMHHHRGADRVEESNARAEPITQRPPGVVRSAAVHDRSRPVLALHALNLAGNHVQRLIPGDTFISRDTAVLRIAFAFRVEVHALHGIKQPIRRVHHGFPSERVAADRGLSRWREALAPGLNRPRLRVFVIEIDGGNPEDLVVFHIDEYRPAIRIAGKALHAVAHVCAVLGPSGQQHVQSFGKPDRQCVGPLNFDLEVLYGMQEIELSPIGLHDAGGKFGALKGHYDVRIMHAGFRRHFAVLEIEAAALRIVAELDLRREIPLLQALPKSRMALCCHTQHLFQNQKRQRELHTREGHPLPHKSRFTRL